MHKYIALAAVAASALLVTSAYAESAPGRLEVATDGTLTMRVPVAGKTQDQVRHDIDFATRAVCRPVSTTPSLFHACVDQAASDAQAQLTRLTAANAGVKQLAQN